MTAAVREPRAASAADPSRRGRASRAKGRRAEQELVRLARESGIEAVRTWWLAKDTNPALRRCDVLLKLDAERGIPAQVKVRRAGFGSLYEALEAVGVAFVRQDGGEWLGIMRAEHLLGLLAGNSGRSVPPP